MLGRIVVSSQEIESMVERLAEELEADLDGKAPVFIGVLKGCVFFLTDLTRRIRSSVELDFIQVSILSMLSLILWLKQHPAKLYFS